MKKKETKKITSGKRIKEGRGDWVTGRLENKRPETGRLGDWETGDRGLETGDWVVRRPEKRRPETGEGKPVNWDDRILIRDKRGGI